MNNFSVSFSIVLPDKEDQEFDNFPMALSTYNTIDGRKALFLIIRDERGNAIEEKELLSVRFLVEIGNEKEQSC